VELLAGYQEKLYAENARALLVVLQALDAAGKDSTIKHVMSGVNPAGCQVTSFKAPSAEELEHDFLWRCVKALPARGNIGLFNRSHYEGGAGGARPSAVPERPAPAAADAGRGALAAALPADQRLRAPSGGERRRNRQDLPQRLQGKSQLEAQWSASTSRRSTGNSTLTTSKSGQHWDAYLAAYQEVLQHTSTPWAPWYVAPADRKWFARIAVAAIIANKLMEMDPRFPPSAPAQRAEMLACRQTLLAEGHAAPSR
jgi:hypothetical protein